MTDPKIKRTSYHLAKADVEQGKDYIYDYYINYMYLEWIIKNTTIGDHTRKLCSTKIKEKMVALAKKLEQLDLFSNSKSSEEDVEKLLNKKSIKYH